MKKVVNSANWIAPSPYASKNVFLRKLAVSATEGGNVVARRVSAYCVVFFCFLLLLTWSCADPEPEGFPELSGPYLGQAAPGQTPGIFAPGVVSTVYGGEWSTAFTPDGREYFFGLVTEDQSFIVHMKEEDGRWTEPALADFSGAYDDFDFTMSPDGNRLYFTSSRPAEGSGPAIESPDIWYVNRTDSGWGEPVRFPEPVNTPDRELYPSESRDGFIYFFSSRPGGFGGSDIYRAAIVEDGFAAPENLGPMVNSEAGEGDPCISPDGDYIVFSSRREEGLGDGDLYVSFKLDDGTWSKARNLGNAVNTEHLEFCPSVSRDGKFLFFTSNRPKPPKMPEFASTVREELGVTPSTTRPDIDIYWVEVSVIEDLRPSND